MYGNKQHTCPRASRGPSYRQHRTKYSEKWLIPFILTWALTLSCKRDMGSLLCFITTRYGSFCTAPISSWNFWRDDCLITRVFAERQNMQMQNVTGLVQSSHFLSFINMCNKSLLLLMLDAVFFKVYVLVRLLLCVIGLVKINVDFI